MDKRFFLALLLTAIVIVAPPLLFPTKTPPRSPSTIADSASRATPVAPGSVGTQAERTSVADSTPGAPGAPGTTGASTAPALSADQGSSVAPPGTAATTVDTTTIRTKFATYAFSSRGGVPVSISLDSYPSRRPLAGKQSSELLPPRIPLSRYRLVLGRDTIALDTVPLRAELRTANGAPSLSYTGTAAGRPVSVTYDIAPDSFLLHVSITAAGAPPGSAALVE